MIISQEDKLTMDDDMRMTLMLGIMPKEYVKEMREKLNKDKITELHDFEQALQDEINDRKMDSEMARGRPINDVSRQEERGRSDDDEETYEEKTICVDELQSWVCGLAAKERGRSRSRSRDSDERPAKQPNKGKGKGACWVCGEEGHQARNCPKSNKGKGKGKGGGGPCWICNGPHYQRECPHNQEGKATMPTSSAWSSWRPGPFPGPSAAQWRGWLPKMGKGKGKSKGKGKKG